MYFSIQWYIIIIIYIVEKTEENQDNADENEYDEILPLSFEILNDDLKVSNDQELSKETNGIEKHSCQIIIYTKNNSFYVEGPQYCERDFYYWNIGWLDTKNSLFYEVNTLNRSIILYNDIFDSWLDFLQKLLDDKIYENLFMNFSFDKLAKLPNKPLLLLLILYSFLRLLISIRLSLIYIPTFSL